MYHWGRGALRKWIGGLSMTLALILHATVAETVIGMLGCEYVSLPQRALSSLDGRAGYTPPPALASQSASVLLLMSDPFFVCFEGQHTFVGAVAAIALALYIVALPVAAFYWLWRSPRLAAELRAQRAMTAENRKGDSLPTLTESIKPTGEILVLSIKGKLRGASSPLPPIDPLLGPFMEESGYAARFWFWRHIDLLAMLILAANQAAQPRPSTVFKIVRALHVRFAFKFHGYNLNCFFTAES